MAKPPHATAIVIAAYNEEQRLPAVIASVKAAGWPWIVVVDDGSRDATAAVAKKAGADVVVQKPNQGQGAALRTGITYAITKGAERVVTYDADGQFLPKEIKAVVTPVLRGEVDVVLGSRFIGKTVNMTFRKRVMLKCAVLFTRIISGLRVTDTHNGFRCFSRTAATQIQITQNRMEHASEIIDEVARHRLPWKEVPVTIIYHHEGQHPARSIAMGFRLLWWKTKRIFGKA
jgi:glycosyltransferase involved in cell wall biosynthesis